MTGSDIGQYRAAVGNFYFSCRSTSKRMLYCMFDLHRLLRNLLPHFKLFGKTLHRYICSGRYIHLLFSFQIIYFILVISGDIETNPGPNTAIHTLDIFHLNVRSIRHKIQQLISTALDFDILCFTESHLCNNIRNEDIAIDGFNTIFRKDRNAFGGGVLMYISNSIKANRRPEFEPLNTECIWIEISQPTCNFFLCCVYRAPNSDSTFWKNFAWSVEKVSDISSKIIIVGDLNVDFLNIPNLHTIYEILSSCYLTNTIEEATRITQSSSTLLDPILVSADLSVFDSGTIMFENNVSDHKGTFVYIKSKIEQNNAYIRSIWSYKNADFDKLASLIKHTDWDSKILGAVFPHIILVFFL